MRSGFSLLELSVVLVIIGLLAGGVMAGQSLIRAAELRSVMTEYGRFATASNTFRDKYQGIPGDFTRATFFFGKDNAACSSDSGTATTPGTCNGNGNGVVSFAAANSTTGETFQLWRQLNLSGLLEGNYTGIAGPATSSWSAVGSDHLIGINTPDSKFPSAGWGVAPLGEYSGDGATRTGSYGNTLAFGAYIAGYIPGRNLLKVEDAWNIDVKLDDGRPGVGLILGGDWPYCSTSATTSDTTGLYNLSNTTAKQCMLYFTKAF